MACAPLMKDGYLSAQQHFSFLFKTLSVYEKKLYSVLFLNGDNLSVKKCFADLCGVPLILCNTHKLNLAIERWIKEQPVVRPLTDGSVPPRFWMRAD